MAVSVETCDVSSSECRAESELARFDRIYLAANFYKSILDRSQRQAVDAPITRNLGKRWQLVRSDVPNNGESPLDLEQIMETWAKSDRFLAKHRWPSPSD
jgi:hypothetical protein